MASVEAADIRTVALVLRDSNPIHFDPAAARAMGMGDRVVNQGASTMAYVIDMVTDWAGSRAALRRFRCKLLASVCAGDDVEVGGRVVGRTTDERGTVVECEAWADVVGGARVLTAEVSVVVDESAP